MNSEERFKKSLEELLAMKEFSFDEANWEKAQQMIHAYKTRKRRAVPFALAGILLLGSLLTGFYFLSNSPVFVSKKIALTENKEINPLSDSYISQGIETKTRPASLPQTIQAPKTKILNPTITDDSVKLPSTNEKSIVYTEKNEPAKQVNVPLSIEPNIVEPVKQNDEDKKTPDTKKENTVGHILNPITKNINSVEKTEGVTEETKMQNSIKSDVLPMVNAGEQRSEKGKISDEHFATDVVAPVGNTENVNTEVKPLDAVDAASKNTKSVNEVIKENPSIAVNDSVKNNLSLSTKNMLSDNDHGQIGKPKDLPVLFSVEAGANYMFGWQNPGARDANGFNPVFGINYFNNFKSKMSISFGIQYTSVSNLSYSNYTAKVKRLSLGEETKVSIYTPVKVHYLIAPLRFNYNINALNTLGIGCNIAYLLNIQSEVETYTEKLNVKYDQALTKESGYTEGFKQYDTQISVFYKRSLYPNLALNLELFYGLTDIKENDFFKSGVFERNTGIKLTLVYNILKR